MPQHGAGRKAKEAERERGGGKDLARIPPHPLPTAASQGSGARGHAPTQAGTHTAKQHLFLHSLQLEG